MKSRLPVLPLIAALALAGTLMNLPLYATQIEQIVVSFRTGVDAGDLYDIFRMNSDGTGMVNLTQDFGANAGGPRISPDGTRIAFQSWNGSASSIWVMNTDGSGKVQTSLADQLYGPGLGGWLNDHTLLVYSGPAAGTGRLTTYDLSTHVQTEIVGAFAGNNNVGVDSTFSAAAGKIAFVAQVGSWSPTYDVYTTDADGTGLQTVFADSSDNVMDRSPIWSNSGDQLYWARSHSSGANHDFEIVTLDSASGLPVVVRAYDGFAAVPYATSLTDAALLFWHDTGSTIDTLKVFDLATDTEMTLLEASSISGADWGLLEVSSVPDAGSTLALFSLAMVSFLRAFRRN